MILPSFILNGTKLFAMHRQGPKNLLYSIGISPAQFLINQEQANKALTPVLSVCAWLACNIGQRNSNAVQYYFSDLVYRFNIYGFFGFYRVDHEFMDEY